MSDSENDDCVEKKGGEWPSEGPFYGGPFPSRTWSRYIPPCPNYNNFTKEQLDMRRKTELLQYKNARSDRTKKKRYAYLAKNPSVRLGSSNERDENCVTTTRECDVPGPTMNLFIDRNVPIFGLRTVRSYGNSGNKDDKSVKLPTNLENIHVINHQTKHTNITLPLLFL